MTLVSPISRSRSASSSTSRALLTTTCFFTAHLCQISSSTLMLTGSVVPTLTGPLRATRCSWVTTSSLGPRSVRTSSYVQALRRGTVSWPTAWAEMCWLRQLLVELHNPLLRVTLVYCNNVSAVYLSNNLIQYQCTKHVEIDLQFVREHVADGDVHVLHVPRRFRSSPTSSSRGCPPWRARSFGPISISAVARVSTAGLL
jgi:hypothetical protein